MLWKIKVDLARNSHNVHLIVNLRPLKVDIDYWNGKTRQDFFFFFVFFGLGLSGVLSIWICTFRGNSINMICNYRPNYCFSTDGTQWHFGQGKITLCRTVQLGGIPGPPGHKVPVVPPHTPEVVLYWWPPNLIKIGIVSPLCYLVRGKFQDSQKSFRNIN